MNLSPYHDRRIALLLCAETPDGEKDWAVFPGVVRVRGDALVLERPGDQPDIELPREWYERIQPVAETVREILQGADYVISLSVGPVPADSSGFAPFGLKWPR